MTETKYGPTPNGGAKCVAVFSDDLGASAPKETATRVQIIEYSTTGEEIQRVYMDREPPTNNLSDAEVTAAAQEVDPPTSEAQAEAGTYKKGHIRIQGLDVAIETPRGQVRFGHDIPLPAHYGYFKRTTGKDGDQVDLFIGPNPESKRIFIVDQTKEDGTTFDEHKALLGFDSQGEAVNAYLDSYTPGWKLGPVTEMSIDQFMDWLNEGDFSRPISEIKKVPEPDSQEILANDKDAKGHGSFKRGVHAITATVEGTIKEIASSAFYKLPRPLQKVVKKSFELAFSTWIAGHHLAERVARERGATPKQAAKLRAALFASDLAIFKPVAAVSGILLNPGLAGAISMVPPATAAYLLVSTAKNPMATMRAAKHYVLRSRAEERKDKTPPVVPHMGVPAMNVAEDSASQIGTALKEHDYSDDYLAALIVALEETHDLQEALELAERATTVMSVRNVNLKGCNQFTGSGCNGGAVEPSAKEDDAKEFVIPEGHEAIGAPPDKKPETPYTYHGVGCSKKTYDEWKAEEKNGRCPWCGKAKKAQYGGMRKHLRSCEAKPTTNANPKGCNQHTGKGCAEGNDSQKGLDTPEFKEWFKNSKVVDKEGKPLRVFHGTPGGLSYNDDYLPALQRAVAVAYKAIGKEGQEPKTIDIKEAYGWQDTLEKFAGKHPGAIPDEVLSQAKSQKPFEAFDLSLTRSNTGSRDAEGGFYFTPSRTMASYFLTKKEFDPMLGIGQERETGQSHLFEVYLSIKNPLDLRHGSMESSKALQKSAMARLDELKKQGYDGVVNWVRDPWGKRQTEWVAFSPSQIKSVGNRGTFDAKNDRINNANPQGCNQFTGPNCSGETVGDAPAFGRSRRTRYFDNPITGPNGTKLVAYTWKYKVEDLPDREGDVKARRVSDWEEAVPSEHTGREIVHHFEVETPDGKGQVVSMESALKLMGYTKDDVGAKAVKSLGASIKTRAKNQLELDRARDVDARYTKAANEASTRAMDLKAPEPVERDVNDNTREVKVGDGYQWYHVSQVSEEMKSDRGYVSALESRNKETHEQAVESALRSWHENRTQELIPQNLKDEVKEIFGHPDSRQSKIQDLEKRLAKLDKKLKMSEKPVGNANPRGCNQHTGKGCVSGSKVEDSEDTDTTFDRFVYDAKHFGAAFTDKYRKGLNETLIEANQHQGKLVKALHFGTVRDALQSEFAAEVSPGVLETPVVFATSVNGQHLNGGACGTEEKTGGPIIVLNPEEGSLHTLFHEIKHMEDKAKGVNVPNELEILKGEMTPERYRAYRALPAERRAEQYADRVLKRVWRKKQAVGNANPRGCNQHTGANCAGGKSAVDTKDGDKYFSDKAFKEAEDFTGNPKSRDTLIRMPVQDFLDVAAPITGPDGHVGKGSIDKRERIDKLLADGTKFNDIPYLGFEHDGKGAAEVVAHEGRHRAMALRDRGVTHMPVIFTSRPGKYGGAIRWGSQEDGNRDQIQGTWPTRLYSQVEDEKEGVLPKVIKFPVEDLRKKKETLENAAQVFLMEA